MIRWKFEELRGRISPIPSVTQIAKEAKLSRYTLQKIKNSESTRVDFDTINALLSWFSDQLEEELNTNDLLEWMEDDSEPSC